MANAKLHRLADAFANKFEKEKTNIQNHSTIDDNVYNGTAKINTL